MMVKKIEITPADIMPMSEYGAERKQRRQEITRRKKLRRLALGPFATFYFESYETMWHQVHEMLYIEKGGEDQLKDELEAYNPLIPKGRNLVCTLMFEIEDEVRRRNTLKRLGWVEDTITIAFDGETIKAEPEQDVERTTADGKTSAVHFLHFRFTDEQAEKFTKDGTQVIVGAAHENYMHMAVLPEAVRAELAGDLA